MTRFIHAVRHEVTIQYRQILVASGAIAGAMLLFGLLSWLGGVEIVNVWEGFPLATVILGVILASNQFNELRTDGHRIAFLLRPATVWEKVGAKVLVSTVFVWAALLLAYTAASLLSAGLYVIVAGTGSEPVLAAAFGAGTWGILVRDTLRGYLIIHAVFFFGSVYFRRHTFGRTLLAAVSWLGTYAILAAISVRIIFGRYIEGSYPGSGHARAFGFEFGPGESFSFNADMWAEIAPWYLQNPQVLEPVLTTGLIVGLWLLTVLRLRETEA